MDICRKAVYTGKERPRPEIVAAAERMRRRRVDQDETEQRLAQLLGEGCWRQRLKMPYALCLHPTATLSLCTAGMIIDYRRYDAACILLETAHHV